MQLSRFAITGIVMILLAAIGLAGCAPAAAPAQPAQAPTAAAPATTPAAPAAPAATTSGAADAAVKVARVQGFGLFLTDNADRTLYAYANDTKDTSNCTAACAQKWPAFIAHATPQAPSNINASLLTTFKRPDGTLQVEYDSHPLYYFSGDQKPGDVNGRGVGSVWHVLSPRGNPMLNGYNPAPTITPAGQ
jgi:predicted lipoprotein with Yx(FWY)xxD motif